MRKSKSKIVVIFMILITLIGALFFFYFRFFSQNNFLYRQIEQDLRKSADNFINNTKGNYDKIFLSFETLNYKIDSTCSSDGGVYIVKKGNKYNYEYYYSCKNKDSLPISEIKKTNDSLSDYLVIQGDNPLYLGSRAEYSEKGYTLKKGLLKIEEKIQEENGVYYVDYNVSHNNKKYTLKRIVIIDKLKKEDGDKEKPNITLLGEDTIMLKLGEKYEEPGYKAIDSIDGDITHKVEIDNIVDTAKAGNYVIIYTVTNSNNQSFSITRNVIVESDGFSPQITLKGSDVINLKIGDNYKEPGYTAIDQIDGDITHHVKIKNNINSQRVGIYHVTYQVTNSHNKTIMSTRTVIVSDYSVPLIDLKGSSTIRLKIGDSYTEPGYSAIDKNDGNLTSKVVVKSTVDLNKTGTYKITYTVTNSDKKSATAQRTVIVRDLSVPTINLKGSSVIQLKVGDNYNEPGYNADDKNDGNLTSKVIVKSNVNLNKAGTYKITYTVTNSDKKSTTVQRTIVIRELSTPLIELKGNTTLYLNLGDIYIEPGYIATDPIEGNITNRVIVNSNLNVNLEGTYIITYSVTNNDQKSFSISRKVIVKKLIKEFSYTSGVKPTEYTNGQVTITFNITGDGYKHILLPDNTTSTNKTISYKVSSNGTYTFKLFNIDGSCKTKTIKINNIDNENPSGSCSAVINKSNTVIEVQASDNIGIKNYTYMDNSKVISTSELNSFTYNAETSNNVSVKITDVASNSKVITCKVVDNSYAAPIKPSSNETIIKQEETSTLNVYISKTGNYYITRVWSKNPYNQLNKFDSPEYGVNLYTPKSLLEKAVNSKSLQNKLIVGFNASGFYLRDTYDSDSVNKYPAYNKTSVGTLVITDGKIIRNAYDKSYKTWYTMGIDKNNKLRIFEDYKTTDYELKKQWSNTVYNTGIRNTFTFASPLVENGAASNKTTSMPSISSRVGRQAICQINENNFALITGSALNRDDLINIMLSLNCQTGTNLDGGGSLALLYKSSSSNTIETVIGNNRSLTEVGYFVQ